MAPSQPWTAACQVGQPDTTGDVLPYTVTLTNDTGTTGDAYDISVVFLSGAQELESGTTNGPVQVLAGQTMTVSDTVPGANPAYGTDSEPMNAVDGCQVTSIGP